MCCVFGKRSKRVQRIQVGSSPDEEKGIY